MKKVRTTFTGSCLSFCNNPLAEYPIGALLFSALLLGCSSPDRTDQTSTEESVTDSLTIMLPEDLSYQDLYGIYRHESTGAGLVAEIEISARGNDLGFILSLQQNRCEWNLEGVLLFLYHHDNEYAFFFDSTTCRLVFTFFSNLKQLRVEEAGICLAHPPGCAPTGIYNFVHSAE
jgi:hypothetical protein